MSSTVVLCRVTSIGQVPKYSKKTFAAALADLMYASQISYPRLAAATKTVDPSGKGLSHAYLHRLAHGAKSPPPSTVSVIAAALKVSPEYFREYREHLAAQRAKLLASEIGLDEVLAALDDLEARQRRRDAPTDD